MTEMTIYGRGGQGGVTLAKLIATAHFLRGRYVQAFGVYAAERSGAPLQAFVRVDDADITNHNQVTQPDHVIVLDRTLIGPPIVRGHNASGWVILNTPQLSSAFAELLEGRQVAWLDATGIAVGEGLGTRTVPIVNTTMLGAVGRVLGLDLDDIEAALGELKFGGANVSAARRAFEAVETSKLDGTPGITVANVASEVAGIVERGGGELPRIQTGSWATRKPERRRLTPPCNDNCPAGNDVQGFIHAVGKGDYDRGLAILLETTPFPSICGRVCPAPCMDVCNRATFDEAVNVRDLERFAGDRGSRPDVTQPHRDERVAVVGSGPAGLSATYHLARLGYPVSLFEVGEELGGVMRTGIPAYRLPRDVLDREVAHILAHGVTVFTGDQVDKRALLSMSRRFSAVFVATGLADSRMLDLGRPLSTAVMQGIDFLDRARRGNESLTGQHVVVVGGGNTAIDSARTARRLGARSVRIVYRRTRDQMPAIKEEIEEAIQENIFLDELVMPLRLREDAGASLLTCTRMKLGDPDESGRPRPVPVVSEDAHFDIQCDRVILALGQTTDLTILPEGAAVREGESLLGLTGAAIFAGGDFATNDGTVAGAIGSGRRAAWHIHRTLTGEDLFPAPAEPVATPEYVTTQLFSHAPRIEGEVVAPRERRQSFTEVRRGLCDEGSVSPAVEEAERCFSCGVCNTCDRCVTHCPEGIVVRDRAEYRFDYDYCKGCGICATQCPRGVIYMAEL